MRHPEVPARLEGVARLAVAAVALAACDAAGALDRCEDARRAWAGPGAWTDAHYVLSALPFHAAAAYNGAWSRWMFINFSPNQTLRDSRLRGHAGRAAAAAAAAARAA